MSLFVGDKYVCMQAMFCVFGEAAARAGSSLLFKWSRRRATPLTAVAICNRAESELSVYNKHTVHLLRTVNAVCVCEWQVHQLLYKFRDSTLRADKGSANKF